MLKKLLTLLFAVVVSVGFMSTASSAGVAKGQKIYLKFLKRSCGMDGGEMAKKHTQAEWEALQEAGKINEELTKLCPDAKPLNDRYVPHVYDFLHNYASDSGNVPS